MDETTLIETETRSADYGMPAQVAIVECRGDRILICQMFGGIDSLAGGMPRWRHGVACRLRPDDTLATIVLGDVVRGYDKDRPVLDWDGIVVRRIAEAVGLPGE